MTVFADSSAVVKLYADEFQHDEVRSLGALYVSEICRVEVPGALWRKNRMGQLSDQHASLLVQAFESDFFDDEGPLVALRISAELLEEAAALLPRHGLRAYDAVQLASALAARTVDPSCDSLAAFDRELRQAAVREGFALVPAVIA